MDGLTADAMAGRPTSVLAAQDEKAALAYIRLCEDELELRGAGWISHETWAIWSAGIEAQLKNRWPFRSLWDDVRLTNEPPAPGGEYKVLIKYLTDGKDPYLDLPVRTRFWKAITPSH